MRILYLATADARGHLMRAQLLTHALRQQGAQVRVLTTSDQGAAFLAGFGIEALVLSRHYGVVFDEQQNMLRQETDRNVAQYLFYPRHLLKDLFRLRQELKQVDLVVNDSFHPALLVMGCLPVWRRKVVHVFGASLRYALEQNFAGRLPRWVSASFHRVVAWQIGAARGTITHDFAYQGKSSPAPGAYLLPTPVALARESPLPGGPLAAVYLNPHFQDPALAQAVEAGLGAAGLTPHLVGEGYVKRPGWLGQDRDWVDRAAHCRVIISAPGMAALSVAQVYRKPILLLLTDQPEQQSNARRAAELGLLHRTLIWRGAGPAFAQQLQVALGELLVATPDGGAKPGCEEARRRLQSWVEALATLATSPR